MQDADRSATTGFGSNESGASTDAAPDVVEPGQPGGSDETPQVARVDRDLVRTATLEGRIATLKASITRLQGFLAEASDAGQIGTLESELLRREIELEGIQGQLRTIEAHVAESTVTLTITELGKRSDPLVEDDDGVGFIDGLTGG